MDFKGMLVSVGFSMAKIPIPPLMLLGKMTGVSNRLLLSCDSIGETVPS